MRNKFVIGGIPRKPDSNDTVYPPLDKASVYNPLLEVNLKFLQRFTIPKSDDSNSSYVTSIYLQSRSLTKGHKYFFGTSDGKFYQYTDKMKIINEISISTNESIVDIHGASNGNVID